MIIKFLNTDPRAGQTATMDSIRGQQLIDSGAAVRMPENETATGYDPAPADADRPAAIIGQPADTTASAEIETAGRKRKGVTDAPTPTNAD